MKVWLYYAHPSMVYPNDEDVKTTAKKFGEDAEVLYAMTTSKEDAKAFKKVRNMDIFHEVVEEISEEDWRRISSENRDCYLEYHKVMTKKPVKDKSYPMECAWVKILVTFYEMVDIEDNADVENVIMGKFAEATSPIGILGVPIMKSLFKLHYWDTLRVANELEYRVDTSLCPWTDTDQQMIALLDEIDYTLEIDQLEYFIRHYGHTLAGK